MRIIELFAGIGACSKALENLGYDLEVLDAVEIDKYAIKSFNAIHGTNFEPQDITKWDKYFENVDIITHGSPCQDFSLAGKQAGGNLGSGTRSSLMYETIRIVGKIRPKYVLWENVKNLLSKKHKHNFDAYIETMNNLGYTSYYQVLNAKDYGIPQNRERVYTISIRNDIDKGYEFPKGEESKNKIIEYNHNAKHQQDLIQDEKGLCRCIPAGTHGSTPHLLKTVVGYNFPPKQELKLRLKDILEDNVDEKYYLSEKALNYVLDMNDVQVGTKWEGSTKNGSINKPIAMTIGCRSASCQRAGITNYIVDNEENEITVQEAKERVKNTTNLRIRKLTPKECWRLMGFDDESFEKAKSVPTSDTQLYKQAGNSIVVKVLEKIFANLLK